MCSLPVFIPGVGKGCDKHQLQQDEGEASTDANVMPGCKWGTSGNNVANDITPGSLPTLFFLENVLAYS